MLSNSVLSVNEGATFYAKNHSLAEAAIAVLAAEQPITLRGLLYRLISTGVLANLQREYRRLGSVATKLRESGTIPFTWIVDHLRATLKPSSWTGLADYGDAVRECYRKNLWAEMPDHVEIFVEKDAIAGVIQPVTAEFDVSLNVCRGYASLSFIGEIASQWSRIEKPIFAYYLGDFDPSGFDIERDLREKLERYSGRSFFWARLGVMGSDFELFDLIELPVKKGDKRSRAFRDEHGDCCSELDALPPTELRRRVNDAIQSHIDQSRWEKLKEVELLEQQVLLDFASQLDRKVDLDSVLPNEAAE